MTREEQKFMIKCNLSGIKVSWEREHITFNGKKLDLLILEKPNKWEINLLVDPDDVNKDPGRIFAQAWKKVLRAEEETNPKELYERENRLWEETLRTVLAKEIRDAGRITRPDGRRTSR